MGRDSERDRLLDNPLFRLLVLAVGEDLAALDLAKAQADLGLMRWVRAATMFAPLGWAFTGRSLPSDTIATAIDVWNTDGLPAEVDDILATGWSDTVHLR